MDLKKRGPFRAPFFLCISLLLLSGCSYVSQVHSQINIDTKRLILGEAYIGANKIPIRFGYQIVPGQTAIDIIIEGDGDAYVTKRVASKNPTPSNPVGLYLAYTASEMGERSVLYLGRPCQYVQIKKHPGCTKRIWTNERRSNWVVEGYTKFIKKFLSENLHQQLNLYGYSGGATISILLSDRLPGVNQIKTIAGLLNVGFLHKRKRVPLPYPQNDPAKLTDRFREIPQIHYLGLQDQVIPSDSSLSLAKTIGDCAKFKILDASHTRNWDMYFGEILQDKMKC